MLWRDKPAKMSDSIKDIVTSVCKFYGYSNMLMISGAGHDAQVMAKYCKSGLIFIPSAKGISHSAKEHSSDRNLEIGTTVLYKTLCKLLYNKNL